VGVLVGVKLGVLDGVFVGVPVGVLVGVRVGVSVGVLVRVEVGVLEGVLVGVAVGVSVNVSVAVIVDVSVTVLVIVSLVRAFDCIKLLGVGVTRIMITSLGVLVGIGVSVGVATFSKRGVGGMIGAGTNIIPMAPTSISTNPVTKLIIKSLGYVIPVKKPNQYTIYQFTI